MCMPRYLERQTYRHGGLGQEHVGVRRTHVTAMSGRDVLVGFSDEHLADEQGDIVVPGACLL